MGSYFRGENLSDFELDELNSGNDSGNDNGGRRWVLEADINHFIMIIKVL